MYLHKTIECASALPDEQVLAEMKYLNIAACWIRSPEFIDSQKIEY